MIISIFGSIFYIDTCICSALQSFFVNSLVLSIDFFIITHFLFVFFYFLATKLPCYFIQFLWNKILFIVKLFQTKYGLIVNKLAFFSNYFSSFYNKLLLFLLKFSFVRYFKNVCFTGFVKHFFVFFAYFLSYAFLQVFYYFLPFLVMFFRVFFVIFSTFPRFYALFCFSFITNITFIAKHCTNIIFVELILKLINCFHLKNYLLHFQFKLYFKYICTFLVQYIFAFTILVLAVSLLNLFYVQIYK